MIFLSFEEDALLTANILEYDQIKAGRFMFVSLAI